MKSLFACLFLVSCGSSVEKLADVIASANATATPSFPVVTPKPTEIPTKKRDIIEDYKKIEKGMKREKVIEILGEPHEKRENTLCSNGECEDYEYLKWYYGSKLLSVTIQKNIVTFYYTM